MAWIAANWSACISVLMTLIAGIVSVLHIVGQNSMAASLQNVEDILAKIAGNQANPPVSKL